jgi:superfamily II DNA or RNA helicase
MEGSGLRILEKCGPIWHRPDDDVAHSVIIPALKASSHFDCMVGFFCGSALEELAPGLASYFWESKNPVRLLVSPIISEEDQDAILVGSRTAKEALEDSLCRAFLDPFTTESALVHHAKRCLAFLVASGRLRMKAVYVKNALFHLKEWVFRSGNDVAILSGSANFTRQALRTNIEQLVLHRSWMGGDNSAACESVLQEFEDYWLEDKPGIVILELPEAIEAGLVKGYATGSPPTEADFQRALAISSSKRQTAGFRDGPSEMDPSPRTFSIPPSVIWESGPFSHQGDAVRAWEAAGRHGILSMATGSGKTITALICAHRLSQEVGKLLIVATAPTRPLVQQWEDEFRRFQLEPYIATGQSVKRRRASIDARLEALTYSDSSVEALVLSNDLFLSESKVRDLLKGLRQPILLIADEVHNLGTRSFLDNQPQWIGYRLGLSATPVRQYDDDGTKGLIDFFGNVVFEFGLERAIGLCLVPYDYHLYPVELEGSELEKYRNISDKIRKAILMSGTKPSSEDEARLQLLLNKRRVVLETASKKIALLKELLECKINNGLLKHTLIYATDKAPQQLKDVNGLLNDLDIRFHQITQEESGNSRLMGRTISAFRDGLIKVLTAKRVLDEGFNVPEISTAIILASTTTRRQWVQRRGRVLRMCPELAKDHAEIHDFIVIPPQGEPRDEDIKRMVGSEILRCEEFTRLARNRASRNGPMQVIQDVKLSFVV